MKKYGVFGICALMVLLTGACNTARTQQTVWVFFKESAAASNAPPAIGPHTLAHRAQQGIPVFPNDAPLPPALVAKVSATGATIRHQSRWLRAVSVDASPRVIRRIQKMNEVSAIRPVGTLQKTAATTAARKPLIPTVQFAHPADDSAFYGPNYPGIRQLSIPPGHQVGYDGSNIRIAIFDTGFEPQHDALIGRRVIAQRDFINNDKIVANQPGESFDQQRHGTQVWSIMGGYLPGLIVGPAFGAEYILAKIDAEPGDTKIDADRWVAAAEWADSLGARIISSSATFRFRFTDRAPIPYDSLNGDLLAVTRAADEAARRGILVVQAMGTADTDAPGTLSAPADADSMIAVGSVDKFGNPAFFNPGFTARGPTADGRTKPEVVALGTNLIGASSLTRVGFDLGLAGTSYSTAFIAGSAAMFMQAWPDLLPMAVRRAFQLAGTRATNPDNSVGWGVPNVSGAILFPDGISLNTINPIDLTGSITSVAPTFSWTITSINARMRPITYRVEVATDSAFNNVVFTDTVREASSLTANRALPSNPRVFWRVVATTPVGATRASFREQFRVPDWVKLLTFDDEQPSFPNTTLPTFSWSPIAAPPPVGPFTYEVQILSHTTGQIVQSLKNLTASSVRLTEALTPNQSYRWRVIARTKTGQVDTISSVQPFVISTSENPPATILYAPFPNPFPRVEQGVTETRIWFDLAEQGNVELTVHDIRGRILRRLIPARGCAAVLLPAGIYGRSGQTGLDEACIQLQWDGRDDSGNKVPNGTYALQLRTAKDLLRKYIVYAPNR